MIKPKNHINRWTYNRLLAAKKKQDAKNALIIDRLTKIIERRDKEILRLKGMLSDYGLL